MPSSRVSSQCRKWTPMSPKLAGRFFITSTIWEAPPHLKPSYLLSLPPFLTTVKIPDHCVPIYIENLFPLFPSASYSALRFPIDFSLSLLMFIVWYFPIGTQVPHSCMTTTTLKNSNNNQTWFPSYLESFSYWLQDQIQYSYNNKTVFQSSLHAPLPASTQEACGPMVALFSSCHIFLLLSSASTLTTLSALSWPGLLFTFQHFPQGSLYSSPSVPFKCVRCLLCTFSYHKL